jgi:hypothetical protein
MPENQKPAFRPEITKSGRWFVAVVTGNGPNSHIGDFDTEEQAKEWIETKARFWPGGPAKSEPKVIG